MTETASRPVGDVTVPEAPVPQRPAIRLSRWQSLGLAVGSLVLVCGLALGVMLAGGALLHALDPTRHVDLFAALHDRWVVGVLLGIALLWLLPPYPWAKWLVAAGSQEQPAHAGRAEDGGGGPPPSISKNPELLPPAAGESDPRGPVTRTRHQQYPKQQEPGGTAEQ